MKIKIINIILFSLILLFPLTYIGEMIAFIDGSFVSMSTIYTPVIFKILKDVLISIFFISLLFENKR